jgi:hypothetical protein
MKMVSEMNQNEAGGGASGTPGHSGERRHFFVLLAIAVVAVMFVGMVALLYVHEKPAPSAIVVLRVPKIYDGAVATVDSDDGRDISPVRTKLVADKEVRISLSPGRYIVKIEHKGKRIPLPPRYEPVQVLVLIDYSYAPIIVEDPASTQPATQASASDFGER